MNNSKTEISPAQAGTSGKPNDTAQLRAEKSENLARDAGGALAAAPCSALDSVLGVDCSEQTVIMESCIPSTVSEIKGPVGWRVKTLNPSDPENGMFHLRSEPPVSKEEIETLESYCGKLLEPYPLEMQAV